jgi:hypothetical protein
MIVRVYSVESDKTEVEIWTSKDVKPSATDHHGIVEQCLNIAILNAIGDFFPHGFGMSTQHMRSDNTNEELILVHCSGRNVLQQWQDIGEVKITDRSVPDRDFVVSIIDNPAEEH